MEKKKYNKETCIKLLQDKYELLKNQSINRYPKRDDFEVDEVVAIKAYLGPWPRALEISNIKEKKEVNENKLQKRILKKREKTALKIKQKHERIK